MKLIEIVESLNSKVDYKVVETSNDTFITKIDIGNRTVRFSAGLIDANSWDVIFDETKGMNLTYKQTGSGNEFQVFSFIKQSMEEFLSRYHPEYVEFSSSKEDSNRTSLYVKMLKRFLPTTKYYIDSVEDIGSDHRIILKRNE